MQAMRQIYHNTTDNLNIKLPIEFQHRKLEVIILPIEETQQTATQALQQFLDSKDTQALSDLDTGMFSQDRKLDSDRDIDL